MTRATSTMRAASASSPTSRAESRTTSSRRGLQILVNLDHRGAVGADPLVGDGAGCLIQMPDALLRDWADKARPDAAAARPLCRRHVLPAAATSARASIAIRHVRALHRAPRASRWSAGATCRPTTTGLGARVIETMPVIRQAIVAASPTIKDQDAFERKILAIRKQILNNVAALAEQRASAGPARPLHAVVLDPHAGLQGPAAGAAGRELLRGPAQSADGLGAGAGAPALLHQHLPVLAAGAPVPLPGHNGEINTVRGNVNWMYARRQRDDLGAAGRGPRQDVAADPARPVRHRLHRQRARAAGRRRLLAGACDDDADPGGLGRQPADGRRAAGVLRIPRRADGAVGRAGGDRLHRRAPDRRHARPQRPAPGALHRHRRRPCDHGVGGRRAADAGGADRPQVAPAAGQDAADRPRRRPHHRRRRDQARSSPPSTPTKTGCRQTQFKLDDLPELPDTPADSRRTARPNDPTALPATTSRRSATPRKTCSSSSSRWRATATIRSARWAPTRRSPCSRTSRSCSTTTSSRTSPRSPTRRSIRSARSW